MPDTMKRCLPYFLYFLSFITNNDSKAQKISDTLIPDARYYRCLQFADPGFFVPEDSVQLLQTLYKQHSVTKALAREAQRLGLDTLPVVAGDLALIQDLVKNRYLAQLMGNTVNQMVFEAKDSEVYDYYKKHISLFSETGKASYIKVFYRKENDEARARSEISKYQKNLPVSWEQITKLDADGLLLSSDFDMPLNNQQPFTQYLENRKKGDVIGPFKFQDQYALLLLLDITPTTPRPFNEVKDMCRSMLINEKKSKWFLDLEERAKREFPVILK